MKSLTISNSKRFLFLVLILITGTATCTKDSDNSAKYQFKSDNNTCSGIQINGSYSKWQMLNESNSIDVDAYITKKGSYEISTNNINGMQFKASGVLTDTGEYTFHLLGDGVPLSNENTVFTLSSPDQSFCSFDIPVIDYLDTINKSKTAWAFYDNGVYHYGHVDSAFIQLDFTGYYFYFRGTETTNTNASFGLQFYTYGVLRSGTYTDSVNQSFGYTVNQQTIFSTSNKLNTIIIDSYNEATGVVKGRFSWTGENDDGVLHEVKDGKFYTRLLPKGN